jgi:hypothetical protein
MEPAKIRRHPTNFHQPQIQKEHANKGMEKTCDLFMTRPDLVYFINKVMKLINLKTGMEVSGHGCPAEWLLG